MKNLRTEAIACGPTGGTGSSTLVTEQQRSELKKQTFLLAHLFVREDQCKAGVGVKGNKPVMKRLLAETAYFAELDYSRFCSATGLSSQQAKSATRRLGFNLDDPADLRRNRVPSAAITATILTTKQKENSMSIPMDQVLPKKKRTGASVIINDVNAASKLIFDSGEQPTVKSVRRLTGYSYATVARRLAHISPATFHAVDTDQPEPTVVLKATASLRANDEAEAKFSAGEHELSFRLGWPLGVALPASVTISFS